MTQLKLKIFSIKLRRPVFLFDDPAAANFNAAGFLEILEHARLRTFCIKLKTNGILIDEGSGPHQSPGRGNGAESALLLAHPGSS